jgi:HK97 family phage portal protein
MIFGKAKEPIQQQQQTSLQMLTGFTPQFSSPSTNASEYAVVRTSIDAVARNAAKLKPKHVRRVNGNVTIPNSNLDYLLSVRPNPHMDAYSFYYKMFSQVYYKNNAFAYVEYDEAGNHKAIYPIDFSRMELLEFKNEMYIQFHFISGKKLTLPYTEVIHIRRFFVSHDIYGDTTDSALQKALELIHTTDEGVMNAVKSSAYLRGLLKFPTVLKESDLKQSRN